MSGESSPAILLRIEALKENHLVALEAREIEPAMLRVVSETIDLTDFVTVNEIGGHKVLRLDRLRIANRQGSTFDRSLNRSPDIDFGEAMLESLLCLGRRQMIQHTARTGLGGVIVVYRPNIFPRVFL